MKKTVLLWVCLTFFVILTASETVSILQSSDNYLEIEFNNPEYVLTKLSQGNTEYTKIESNGLKSGDYIGKEASPVLPAYSKLINLQGKEIDHVEYIVSSSKEINGIRILPYFDSEKSGSKVEDFEIYTSDKFLPEQIYSYTQPMIMRGALLSNFTINPFSYNPGKSMLKIYEKVIIKIYLKESTIPVSHKMTAGMNNLLNTLSINNVRETSADLPKGSYLYLYATTEANEAMILSILQPLVDWKHRQGYEVITKNTTSLGTTTQSIKNYLVQAYNTWQNPPEFVCLVGDVQGNYMIPTYIENVDVGQMASDYDYTLIEGNDLLPEMFIGRLSIESNSQLASVVNKILKYESQPFMSDDDWYERALLVGDGTNSGVSTMVTMNYVQDLISEYNPSNEIDFVSQPSYVSQIASSINQGVSAYFYRGFGDYSGWTTQDTNALTNINKLPFICEITCFSGMYQNPQICQTEAFLRAGTVTNPRGAVAAIGSSCATHTCINNILTGGIAWGIYKDKLPTIGEALVRGKIALMENYPTNPADYVNIYSKANNLMGDPGMVMWTKKPVQLSLQFPATISLGTNQVDVTATSEGQPVANVWVCLLKGEEIFQSGVTDESGLCRFILPNGYTAGEMKITGSLQNYIPVLANINIVTNNAGIGFLNFEEATPFISGTDFVFRAKVKNYGTTAFTNVTCSISSLNSLLTFTNNSVNFGSIGANTESISQGFITGNISGQCPDGTRLMAMLNITSGTNTWPCLVVLEATAGKLSLETVSLNGPGGNYINPGQSGSVVLTLKNTGSASVSNMNLVLRTLDPRITISDSLSTISMLNPGQTVQLSDNPFQLTANSSIITGSLINFSLTGNESNTTQNFTFGIQIGNAIVSDPTGPDQYGYYCYDDGDTGYISHPEYNWVEIAPAHGGSGTVIPCQDTDTEGSGQITTIDLPFDFRFYSNIYDKISICSNGFIVPGVSNCIDWMNWSIPGPMVPNGIIAPFWDDLMTNNSQLCYYYDEPQHRLIVEWSDFRTKFDDLPATFQVIISDPAFDATTLGDSKLEFQYQEVHNNDTGNYGGAYVDHGEFCTVGISNKKNDSGIQYTYSNNYPVTAKTLQNNMAILFSGPPTAPQNAFIILNEISFTEVIGNNNGIVNNHETININISLKNIGLNSSGIINAHLTSLTNMFIVNQANTTVNNLAYNQSGIPTGNLQFTVANNCPNGFFANLVLHISGNGFDKEFEIPVQVQAPGMDFAGYQVADNNDNYLESGESGTIALKVKNNSNILLNNCDLSLSFDNPDISFSPDEYSIPSLAPGSINTQLFTISIPETLSEGATIVGTLTANFNQYYVETFDFELIIGAPELIFEEDFEGNYMSHFQYFIADVNPSQYINTTGSEVKLFFVDASQQGVIVSNFYHTKPYKKFLVTFKYFNQDGVNPVVFGSGPNMSESIFSWMNSEITAQAESISFISNNFYPNDMSQYFAWLIAFQNGYSPQFAVLDDIKIYGFKKPKGTVNGHVTLNGGTGSLTDVTITDSISVVHPNANGDFTMEVVEGISTIRAFLDGYEVRSFDVEVVASQTSNVNFTLSYLAPPVNLVHTFQGNRIILDWSNEQATRTSRKKEAESSNRLTFDHYKIHFQYNNYNLSFNTTAPHFERNMFGNGHYIIYVTTLYSSDNNTMAESDTSNILEFDYLGTEDVTNLPKEYAMSQNYPNPFNPTTRIDFALPERNTNCNLSVYNIKGEHIKTLISNKPLEAGYYSFSWDGDNKSGKKVGSGIYFFKLKTDKKEFIRKAVMLK